MHEMTYSKQSTEQMHNKQTTDLLLLPSVRVQPAYFLNSKSQAVQKNVCLIALESLRG